MSHSSNTNRRRDSAPLQLSTPLAPATGNTPTPVASTTTTRSSLLVQQQATSPSAAAAVAAARSAAATAGPNGGATSSTTLNSKQHQQSRNSIARSFGSGHHGSTVVGSGTVAGHASARVKLQELFQYWVALDATKDSLAALATKALAEAGLQRAASVQSPVAQRPATPASLSVGGEQPQLNNNGGGAFSFPDPPPSSDGSSAVLASPPAGSGTGNPRSSKASPTHRRGTGSDAAAATTAGPSSSSLMASMEELPGTDEIGSFRLTTPPTTPATATAGDGDSKHIGVPASLHDVGDGEAPHGSGSTRPTIALVEGSSPAAQQLSPSAGPSTAALTSTTSLPADSPTAVGGRRAGASSRRGGGVDASTTSVSDSSLRLSGGGGGDGSTAATVPPGSPSLRPTYAAQHSPTSMRGTPHHHRNGDGGGATPTNRTPRSAHGAQMLMADEMDVAHRYGALSPRSLSPAALHGVDPTTSSGAFNNTLNGSTSGGGAGATVRSPFELNLSRSPRVTPATTTAAGGSPGIATAADGAPPKSRSPSPQFDRRGLQLAPPLNTAASAGGGGDSDRELTPRQSQLSLGRRRSGSSLASSFSSDMAAAAGLGGQQQPPQPPKVPQATLADIPKFYFPKGRPTTLKPSLFDEVAKTAAGPPARSVEEQQLMAKYVSQSQPPSSSSLQSGSGAAGPSGVPRRGGGGVGGRLGSATASSKRGGGIAPLLSAGGGGGAAAAAAAEAMATALRGLATEAFGLPHVLTPLVAQRVSPSSGNNRTTTNGGGGSGSGGAGTTGLSLATVRAYYDTCIAGRSTERRIFEVLLGSGTVGPGVGPGSVAKGGGAPSRERRNYLVREDFTLLLQSLVETHPGLTFLKEASDFQGRYIDTVVHRILYDCDPRDTGRISWDCFVHSALPAAISQLAQTDEINHVLNYFSYEHFYVLYCRFWELDSRKDLMINASDLERYYPEQTANELVVQRIFEGAGRRLTCPAKDRMSFDDFVYFCTAEEDKSTPRALRYWFRVLDTDGDGVLSGHELATFYEVTRRRLEQLTGESIGFPEVISQIADMIFGPEPSALPPVPTVPLADTTTSNNNNKALTTNHPLTAQGTAPVARSPLHGVGMLSASSTLRSGVGGPPPLQQQQQPGPLQAPVDAAGGYDMLLRRLLAKPMTAYYTNNQHGSSPTLQRTHSGANNKLTASSSFSPAAAEGTNTSSSGGGKGKPSKPPSGGKSSSRGLPPPPSSVSPSTDLLAVDPSSSSNTTGPSAAVLHLASLGITLEDLLRRPLAAGVAITMLTNVAKFLQYEQRDPFVVQHERAQGAPERTDWDRFCRAEYDRMSLSEEEG